MKISAKWVAAIVYVVAVVIVSAVMFLLINETDYFWVTYFFTLAAATLLFALFFHFMGDKNRTFREFPANAPYAYIAIQYLVIEVMLAVVFCIFGAFGLRIRFFISAELILALVYGIRLVVAIGAKKEVIGLESDAGVKSKNWQMVAVSVQAIKTKAEGLKEDVRSGAVKILNKLYEDIRYSDPISNGNVSIIETQIHGGIAAVENEIDRLLAGQSNDLGGLNAAAASVGRLLEERNSNLKANKR